MEHCKLQIGCLLVVLYILFIYVKEVRRYGQKHKISMFDALLGVGIISLLLDGLTAYTVNHLDAVNSTVNMLLHAGFLISIDCFIFRLFMYMISITVGLPKKKIGLFLMYSPLLVNIVVVIAFMPQLQYIEGEVSNYSMGVSAYTCFAMAGIYFLLSVATVFRRWDYIEKHKRVNILTYMLMMAVIAIYQMQHPQALLTSLCAVLIIVGVYMNQENPSVVELAKYHEEMIMGFATLVENKDGSTGGHIKRTTMYVRLLAQELRRRGHYKEVLTKDYVRNLCLAAPMHDIGKVSIPDVILQKPGKLTEDEFVRMKQHAENGGKIVQETFANLGNEQYAEIAYQVARYHHEKWNGKGYPDGLKRKEIPLCARIMAIADVFDAVSEKRCYRDAMPLETCFEIIQEGSGQDFDPLLVEVFLDSRDKVEQIHREFES